MTTTIAITIIINEISSLNDDDEDDDDDDDDDDDFDDNYTAGNASYASQLLHTYYVQLYKLLMLYANIILFSQISVRSLAGWL